MAKAKLEKGVLASLAKEVLKDGHSSDHFKSFEEQAIAAGSTTSSARQTWQRIKKELGLVKTTKASKPSGTLKAGVAAPKPKGAGKIRPPKGAKATNYSDEPSSDRETELKALIADGRKYRALVASLAK